MFAHGETITRLRGTPVANPYSGKTDGITWTNADALDIDDCAFNPGESSEPVQDARNAVVTRPEVYAPSGSDVAAGDKVVVRGITYEVDGTPAEWRSPFTGWEAGMVIALKVVDG